MEMNLYSSFNSSAISIKLKLVLPNPCKQKITGLSFFPHSVICTFIFSLLIIVAFQNNYPPYFVFLIYHFTYFYYFQVFPAFFLTQKAAFLLKESSFYAKIYYDLTAIIINLFEFIRIETTFSSF